MAPNFAASILNRPVTEIERPKPLPVGTYLTIIEGLPTYGKSAQKQTDFVEFTHKIIQPCDDVDADELAEVGLTLKDGGPRTMRNTFYLTEDSAWRLKKFLEDLGFDLTDPEITMGQACEAAANREVFVTVKHEPSRDGRSIFANIAGTALVE